MAVKEYIAGNVVRLTLSTVNEAGTPIDVAGIALKILVPGDENATEYSEGDMTHVSTGVYTYEQVVSTLGRWLYRFETTDPNGADEGQFHVVSLGLDADGVGGGGGYALTSEGVVGFNANPLPTNSPEYLRADYEYVVGANGLPNAAFPEIDSYVVVTGSDIVACEAVIHSVPTAAEFQTLGIVMIELAGGSIIESQRHVGIYASDGGSTLNLVTGGTETTTATAAEGFRVGISVDGMTGAYTCHTTDGDVIDSGTFTPGNSVVFGLVLYNTIDEDTPPVGQTASIELLPAAADMQLTYPAGAVDVFGDTI